MFKSFFAAVKEMASVSTLDRFLNALIVVGMVFTLMGFVYVIGKGVGFDAGVKDTVANHPVQNIMYAPGARDRTLNICVFAKDEKTLMCDQVESFFERNRQ